jgi:hypothetical protein
MNACILLKHAMFTIIYITGHSHRHSLYDLVYSKAMLIFTTVEKNSVLLFSV